MPDQANSVSSGLSPLVKTARSGPAELTASAQSASAKGSAFSNDLEQARKHQFDNVDAEAVKGEKHKPGTEGTAVVLKNHLPAAANAQTIGETVGQAVGEAVGEVSVAVVQRENGHLLKEALVDLSSADTGGGTATSHELAESTSSLLPASRETPTDELIRSTTLASAKLATGISPETDGEGPALDAVATKLHGQTGSESMPESLLAAAPELQRSAVNVNTLDNKTAVVDAQAATAHPPRQLASGVEANKADDGAVGASVLSVDEDLDLNAGRVSKEATAGVVEPRTSVEKGAVLSSAAAFAKGRLAVSGDTGVAAMSASENLATVVAVDKSSASLMSAAGLSQLANGNGTVTQATLAGRFRQVGNDLAATRARTPQTVGQTALTQAVLSSLDGKGAEQQPVSDVPATMVGEGQSAMDPLMGVTNTNQTVQQRIAIAEAMLSQMAQEASEATVKAPTADNMLQALSGNTITAPALQSSALATGPIAQAPLNINLMSADADTALAGNVKWMTNEGVKNAVMTVTPHGMGPISVKIGIDGDQMDVSIIAAQHSTRDALESMLPRLREQLSVQGHETVKVDVSDGKSEQARSGNGQAFAESRNPSGASTQDNRSNSSEHGENKEYGHSGDLEVGSDSVMAEDLQRVAARVVGEAGSRPVFDAYV